METIGCARPEELDAVLHVMCKAFGMNFAVARPIFYADPHIAPENKLVVRKAGQVVSCLSLSEHLCWIGQAQVKLAGIAGVATLPEFQRQGLATRLLNFAYDTLKERGFALAALLPLNALYYQRRGWETIGCATCFQIDRQALPPAPASRGLRKVEVNDAELLAATFPSVAAGKTLRLQRDALRWRRLIERLPGGYLYFDELGRLKGWLFYDYRLGSVEIGAQRARLPTLQIQELYAPTPEAQSAFIGYLARQRRTEIVEYSTTHHELAESGLAPYVKSQEQALNCMARVIRFDQVLEALKANWDAVRSEFPLALKLFDPYPQPSMQHVELHLNGATSVVKSISEERYEQHRQRAVGTAQSWVQVLVGTTGALQACEEGRLSPSNPETKALLGQMFPPRHPYLSPLDNF
ncbi:GNAT family N-acetyltransferase [Chthonomonas calidirosea]|uniref:GNAT family N-acetyltransferase n=1 Tax=Chthonomonas calidirosea TaxID=454171 RepID=UPI0006EC7DEB|nr:GNAT family N-acetyltransferase [Chthonomonas calidirosea]CEK15989.1 predicted acetyltransferase [Chthonomonas calidirosea]